MSETARGPRGALLNVALIIVSCLLTAFILEGGASCYLLARDMVAAGGPRPAAWPHTQPDTLLGWVNRPGVSSPGAFGSGISLSTSAQGFRGTRTLAPAPSATVRIACSGDAFTLGYGVDDAHAWCARLESEFQGVETMNLGQVGYGLDQVVLSYERDGTRYLPQLQVLALTDAELERALAPSVAGLAKPHYALDGSRLVTRGVPVPPPDDDALRRAVRMRLFDEVRLVQFARRARKFTGAEQAARDVDAQWPMFDALFASLAEGHRKRGSDVMLAYLPARADLRPGSGDAHRQKIATSAQAHGLPFVDLTPALRAMRPDSQDLAFISQVPAGSVAGVVGQYSNIGNAWVARQVGERIRALTRTGAQLRVPAAPGRGTPARPVRSGGR